MQADKMVKKRFTRRANDLLCRRFSGVLLCNILFVFIVFVQYLQSQEHKSEMRKLLKIRAKKVFQAELAKEEIENDQRFEAFLKQEMTQQEIERFKKMLEDNDPFTISKILDNENSEDVHAKLQTAYNTYVYQKKLKEESTRKMHLAYEMAYNALNSTMYQISDFFKNQVIPKSLLLEIENNKKKLKSFAEYTVYLSLFGADI